MPAVGRKQSQAIDVPFGWQAVVASCGSSLQFSTMRAVIWVCLTAVAVTACSERHEPATCVPVLPGWKTAQSKSADYFVSNTVTLAGQEIRWNGKRIDQPTLVRFTRSLAPNETVPFLIFDPGPSPNCAFATRVRDILNQNYPCRDGACGQGSATDFIPR